MDELSFGRAKKEELAQLIAIFCYDNTGMMREDGSTPINEKYIKAFEKINKSETSELIVARQNRQIIALCQITYMQRLSHLGALGCLVEDVRVHKDFKTKGVGKKLMEHVKGLATKNGCEVLQLAVNKKRVSSIRFFQNIGFKPTHKGFKMPLN